MSSTALSQALLAKCGFETRDVNATARQIRILGRVAQTRVGDVLLLIHALKTKEAQNVGWTVDISKSYFLLNGRVVYCWRLIFQSSTEFTTTIIQDICKVINASPKSAYRELEEAPLVGARPDRNMQNSKGKGAGFLGQLKIGRALSGS